MRASCLINKMFNFRANKASFPRIVVIPNGIDLKTFDSVPADRECINDKCPECKNEKIVLFLSRLHPIKGVENLIEAWAEVQHDPGTAITKTRDNWILLIAGSGENKYVESLKKQVEKFGLAEKVRFFGLVLGEEKIKLMKSADIFVLPTKDENFGIVVAEALACAVPVITTKGAPWSELQGDFVGMQVSEGANARVAPGDVALSSTVETNEFTYSDTNDLCRTDRSGWWVDIGVAPLADALQQAMSLTDLERKQMGVNGRRLVEERYQWSRVVGHMNSIYNWVLHGGDLL
jgi:glycosyltransferase involved in cell wall biosynthesis